METVEIIYKQDALEALRMCYETERIDYTNGNEYINYEQAVHEVEQLSSAQPEKRTQERTETHACDCISRQAAIDAISCDITITGRQNAELVAATIGAFADRIKALPSVQPEITVDGYADGFADGYKQGQMD